MGSRRSGYKVAGLAGAAVAATAAFLPSFIIMLTILPVLDRVRKLAWMRAVMKGMGPAVIGVFKLMIAGAVIGVLRSHVLIIRGFKAAGRLITALS